MRARSIKPGFFKNEELAEVPFEARLLFIGLWCMADRDGILEHRAKRIKAEIFPYDSVNVEKLIDVITSHGFIIQYQQNNNRYIQITNFKKHQNPHPHESKSILPPCNDITLQAVKCNLPAVLTPSSLTPSSLTPSSPPPLHPAAFTQVWNQYPRRKGRKAAERHFNATVKTAVDLQNILRALENYKRSEEFKKGFIQYGSTWFNDWQSWIEGDQHAPNGSEGVSEYADIARRAREAQGLRKASTAGEVLAGVRDLHDVLPKAETRSGYGSNADGKSLEPLRADSVGGRSDV